MTNAITRRAPSLALSLKWRKAGTGWRLFAGSRRFGNVMPDSKYFGMWRSTLSGGRLCGMANLAWAKNAVLEAAIREIEWEERQQPIKDPQNRPEKRGVFERAAAYSDFEGCPATTLAPHPNKPISEAA